MFPAISASCLHETTCFVGMTDAISASFASVAGIDVDDLLVCVFDPYD